MTSIKKLAVSTIRTLAKPFDPILRKIIGVPDIMLEEMPDCPGLFHCYRGLLKTGHKRVQGGWEYEGEFYPDFLTVGGNSFVIRKTAQKYCAGSGLDIGAGFWPFPGSTPIDSDQGPGMAHKIEKIQLGSQDYVFSSHCLEHIPNWGEALDEWISKLRPNGILFLYLPHHTCKLWHLSNPFMAGIHAWAPTIEVIIDALEKRNMEIVDKNEGPDLFQSFFVCARLKK